MKTATRLWYNIAALFATITATCARYVTDPGSALRMDEIAFKRR